MANTVTILSYANTFGDWVVTTNALAKENNDFAANNYFKPTGTLYLQDPSLGLQVSTDASIGKNLRVEGVGSYANVQNNLAVGGQIYFTNPTLGLVNSGQANIGGLLLALGSGTGLQVANNAEINGTFTVDGTTLLHNTTVIGNSSLYGNLNVNNRFIIDTNVNSIIPITAPTIYATKNLFANTGGGNFGTLYVDGQLTVNGNFVLTGTTVYDTNKFTINAGNSVGINSYYMVNRAGSGANAEIRWNENYRYWDLLDVDSGNYYQITTSKTPSTTTFNGTTGQSITSNGVVSFSTTNGVIVSGSSNTISISTAQDIRTSASPTFNRLTLTNPLAINQGGTGATSASGALTNLLPSGQQAGYVLATGGAGSYYWAAGGVGGGGGATPGTTIQSSRLSYLSDGSKLVYTTPAYIPGSSQLRVYVDGVRQFTSEYTETSNVSITLGTAAPLNSNILIEVDGYVVNPYYANNIAFSINSNISSTANTIQLAVDALTSKLVTYYANTSGTVTFASDGTFNGALSLGTPLAITSGGTGATSVTQALNNLLPTGQLAGYVLTTGGSGSYYWAAGGGGGGGSTPGTTINTTRVYPTVNAAQTLFTTPTYTPGSGQLRVYINGVRQFGSEYTETSNTSVTLGTGATAGDVVLLEVDGYINNPYYANTIAFTVNSNISASANTIQLAIDGLTSKLVTYYANTSSSYSNPTWLPSVSLANFANTANALTTSSSYQIGSLGVGTAASGVAGEIRAANNITAYYSSDIRLKENIQDITNAVEMVSTIGGKIFDWKDEVIAARGGEDGYFVTKRDFGVIAQDVQSVFPLAVKQRDDGILAVDYEKLCALAFAAIKELKDEIEILKGNSK